MKHTKSIFQFARLIFLSVIFSGCQQKSDHYTRGIGIYPGNLAEDFSPKLGVDNQSYRNLAKLRPAWHSSSYDYNLTAQLVTDGIITHEMPETIALSTNQGVLPKNEREWLLDHNVVTKISLDGKDIWIQLETRQEASLPEVTKINFNGSLTYSDKNFGGWQFVCSGSNDGKNWTELEKFKGTGLPKQAKPNLVAGTIPKEKKPARIGPYDNDPTVSKPSFSSKLGNPKNQRMINQSFEFEQPVSYHFYRINLSASYAERWTLGDFDFYDHENKLEMTASHNFKSAWMSAGTGEEWVYVDLGTQSTFDHVKLYWINKAIKGSVQVSEDAANWKNVAELPGNSEMFDDISLKSEAKGRFVRVLMTKAESDKKYVLSELEVYGKGGLVPQPKAGPAITNNRMDLVGGSWKIQRISEVTSTGENISQAGFKNNDWVVATVPGTALVSYWNAGALPDPNFGDNQLMISESFFNSDFWYRDEFDVPSSFKGQRMFLNFDGINWKADIFVNGKKIGRIDGAFIRGKFDVSGLIKPGQKNTLAVLIHKNDNIGIVTEQTAHTPDKNGGILGADNPTFHASIGWDWIPTIRGRNIGIWNDVFLNVTGAVTIENHFVTTHLVLPDTTAADINLEVTLRNHAPEAISGTLSGKYGDINFTEKVSLNPSESKVVKLNPANHPELHFKNPKLWWPKGYGAPHLYKVELDFKTADGVSDQKEFNSGVREMSYTEKDQILSMYINGRRFVGRGGNWGFSESNLEYRGREYDAAVAYHADMNFTMIRNWVGQTGDDEFFDACDRHGVMIWQDFWLANPGDGPNPDDPKMFMNNACDFVKRIRNHPSIAIYVGRNEGNPPEVIDTALQTMIKKIHPDIHYIPCSSTGVVSGGGPYRALPPRDYFMLYGYDKFHSERGMPNVMTYESLKQTLPESAIWPQNNQWGIHDYCLEGAQGAAYFNQMIEKGFGKPDNAQKFSELAQWINYSGYRAIFEGRSLYRKGMLLWMSHPAWPSMVWQTYDYYLEPTAAYFGCKKACEPIHIQWNPVFDEIEVVNYSAGNKSGLTAKAQIINMNGSVQWEKETGVDSNEDSTVKCFKLEFPKSLSAVYFIKLTLSSGDKILSDNFYWRGLEDGNYQALRELPVVKLVNNSKVEKSGDNWIITTTLNNTSKSPVLMVRLKAIGNNSGERILPVFYSDNYVSLMPGEKKVIVTRLKDEDTRDEKPGIEISGFNL
jgi:hypothetical protein